jgi:hypothetical protein
MARLGNMILKTPEVQGIDLFIPPVYDLLGSVLLLVTFVVLVWASMSFFKESKHLNVTQSLVWFLLILFVPVLGPIGWLLVGRKVGNPNAVEDSNPQ